MGRMLYRTFRQTFFAFIITALITRIGNVIDGVIISRYLGTASLAALSIGHGFTDFTDIFTGVFAVGNQAIINRLVGKGRIDEANDYICRTMTLTLLFSAVMITVVLIFASPIATFLGANPADAVVHSLARDYLRGFALGVPAIICTALMSPIMQLDNDRKRTFISMFVIAAVNIGGDLLNVHVIHGGMLWMGITTSLSYYAGALILYIHLRKASSVLRLEYLKLDFSILPEIIRNGAPSALARAATTARIIFLNSMSFTLGGFAGTVANGIILNLSSPLSSIPKAFGSASLTVSGVLLGERNRNSLRYNLGYALKYALGVTTVFAVVLCVLAPLIVSIYLDAGSPEFAVTVHGLRWYISSLILYAVNLIFSNFYHAVKRVRLAYVMNMCDNALYVIMIVLLLKGTFGLDAIWLAYFFGRICTLGTLWIYVCIRNRKITFDLNDFLLLDETYNVAKEDLIHISLHSMEEVIGCSSQLVDFCRSHDMSKRRSMAAGMCVEEMAGNIIRHGFSDGRRHQIDVRVTAVNDEITIQIKDDCRPFNPKEWAKINNPADPAANVGIRMSLDLTQELDYINALKINTLTMKI